MKNSNLAQTQKSFNGSAHTEVYNDTNPEYKMSFASPETSREKTKAEFVNAPDELLAGLYVSKNAEWAFNELVNRYSCKIYNLAYKYTKDESNANDVLQEVFLTRYSKSWTLSGASQNSRHGYTELPGIRASCI